MKKDLADLASDGLHSYLKDKLKGFDFLTVNHLQMTAMDLEYRFKKEQESQMTHRSNTDIVDCKFDSSDDEKKEVYVAEFIWPSEAKPYSCSSLKPIQKNRQEEARFTFDVSKCDRKFDELLRNKNIKSSHAAV